MKGNKKIPPSVNVEASETFIIAQKPYRCEICCHLFSKKSSWITHKRIHVKKKSRKSIKHSEISLNNKSLTCNPSVKIIDQDKKVDFAGIDHDQICSKLSPNDNSATSVKVSDDDDKNLDVARTAHGEIKSETDSVNKECHICTTCGKWYRNRSRLIKHEIIHTDIKQYACDICGQRFRHSSSCKKHASVHTKARPYSCNICGKKVKTRDILREHKKRLHGNKPRPDKHECTVCGKVFSGWAGLRNHRRSHAEKLFECLKCNKKFNGKSHYMSHMGTHSHIKPYNCSTCEKKFARRIWLVKHEKAHDIRMQDKCRKANDKINHGHVKKFECRHCDKKVISRYHLSQHEAVHGTHEEPCKPDVPSKKLGKVRLAIKPFKSMLSSKEIIKGFKPHKFKKTPMGKLLFPEMVERDNKLAVTAAINKSNCGFASTTVPTVVYLREIKQEPQENES